MRYHKRTLAKQGLTTIELITVMAILAILVTVTIVGLSHVRLQAMKTTSLSNLRSIGSALLLYASERNGVVPGRYLTGVDASGNPTGNQVESWPLSLYPYLGDESVYISPADPYQPFQERGDRPFDEIPAWQVYKLISYAWNYQIGGIDRRVKPVNIGDYHSPSMAMIIGTSSEGDYSQRFGFIDNTGFRPSETRYQGTVHGLFLDGHVASLNASDFLSQDPYMNWSLVTDHDPNP